MFVGTVIALRVAASVPARQSVDMWTTRCVAHISTEQVQTNSSQAIYLGKTVTRTEPCSRASPPSKDEALSTSIRHPLPPDLPGFTQPSTRRNSHLPDLFDEREEASSRFYTDSGLRTLLFLQGHAQKGLELRRGSPAPQEAAETTHRSEPRGGCAFSWLCGE